MVELPTTTHQKITTLCSAGDSLLQGERYAEAVELYERAWGLLPEPRTQWDAALWIQAAIADAYFLSGQFSAALEPLRLALLSGGVGTPFVHLRLGQCLLETGETDKAIEELTRAYMGGGRELFANDDPKYLEVLRGVVEPPAGEDEL